MEDERDDRDNPADILLKKMMKDSRGKLKNTRRDMIKVGVQIIILFEIPHHPSAVDANISRIFTFLFSFSCKLRSLVISVS